MEGVKFTEETEAPMRIVKNWKRPEQRTHPNPNEFVVSPISGELLPVTEISEHTRISLLHPQYKEQKQSMFSKIRETALARDDEISRNIVGLARKRPDIFGTTEEEVSDAVKTRPETDKRSTATDEQPNIQAKKLPGPAAPPPGHSVPNSVHPPQPPPPLALNLPRVPLNSAVQHYAPPPPPPVIPMIATIPIPNLPSGGLPMMMHHLPPPLLQGVPLPPPLEEAPPPLPVPKRQKQLIDDSPLIPEDQFLAQHPGPVPIRVSVPNLDEGKLQGQVLQVTVQSLSETIGSLKDKIAREILLPANRLKLRGKLGFLKDNVSLSYYNVSRAERLTLTLRQRGGRNR